LSKLIFIVLKTISFLPFWVLYGFSDLLFVLNYYIIGYRKKVVMENLAIAFPEKSIHDRKAISKKFFRQFTDFIVESIKTFSMSEKEFINRYHFENLDEISSYIIEKKQGAVVAASHQFNWEWMIFVGKPMPKDARAYISYTPLSNKILDKLIRKNRERFGLSLVPANKFVKTLNSAHDHRIPISGLISDQSPKKTYKFRTEFFGVNVPVYTGPENIARKLNQSYWILKVVKLKRGYYSVYFDFITHDVHQYDIGELTKIFLRKTEKYIRQQPENYLWTHRRWKHRSNETTVEPD